MSVQVSIILPSLNVRPYIEKCIKSVQNQTLKNIEILCIDAGSTDGTREIIEAHSSEDQRVRLIDSPIRSVGYQLNLGMTVASGKYIGIVETDDYVAAGMYEALFIAAEAQQAELVLQDYEAFWGDNESRQVLHKAVARTSQYGRIIEPGNEQAVFDNDMSIWTGIYSREFLQSNNIRENETPGAAYQDQGFWFQVFICARRLLYLPGAENSYHYRLDNPNSSIHSKRLAYAICEEFAFIKAQMEQRGLWEKYQHTYRRLQFNRYLWNYLRLDDSEQISFLRRFEAENKLPVSPEDFRAKRQQEKKDLQAIFARHSSIILFGCGSDGIRLLDYLRAQGKLSNITALTDNNAALHGTMLFGLRVISPAATVQNYPQACYLIASLNYGEAIRQQLLLAGITEENIWTGHVC